MFTDYTFKLSTKKRLIFNTMLLDCVGSSML